ncbi:MULTISPECIES: phage holin family protein [unclassified Crossiella]|uniref:phage holin family protein n=1 Tax=unclassified Crossiella TaxID=2620835 RepID=UPI00207C1AF3|nr:MULTISPECIES: phage holin family protein [unclassified Crossiella]MCO1581485.1 phage holin family protein [Crossiella sp. SN42]WHT21794.1 phage holin family protein [Crossiella sp. CA-258035]
MRPVVEHADQRSTGELVKSLTEQVSTLVREEMALARAELQEKGKKAGVGAGLAGAAGLLALYGLAAVIAGLVLLLATVLVPWASALVVGAGILVIAGILALAGRAQLKRAVPPIPEQARANVRKDMELIQEGTLR